MTQPYSVKFEPNIPLGSKIAEAVGHLPLALEMLAVRLGAPLQTPLGILEELEKAPTPIEIDVFKESAGSTIERPEGVFATIAGTLASLDAAHRRSLETLDYLADAPALLSLVAAITGLGQDALIRLLDECRPQSFPSEDHGEVEVHALTVAAIAATNPQGSLEKAISCYKRRLNSINETDPVALRKELTHYLSIHQAAAVATVA